MKRRRRALFGGSFDPVHYGHLMVAEALCELERLDEIVFMPAARSPHKNATAASAAARLAMLRLAVRGNPRFRVSDLEVRRRGASFTIDTVRALAARWGERPIVVVGGDALLELHTWREADALLAEARFVVYARPGFEAAAARAAALGLRYHAEVQSPLASHRLRARARAGRSLRYLVPEPVRRYITRTGLYRASRRRA
jgi:nicotinate-nucleotide adenylyltransferase